MNLPLIYKPKPKHHWFSLYEAKKWWESDQNESRAGHFNLRLYLDILELRDKTK